MPWAVVHTVRRSSPRIRWHLLTNSEPRKGRSKIQCKLERRVSKGKRAYVYREVKREQTGDRDALPETLPIPAPLTCTHGKLTDSTNAENRWNSPVCYSGCQNSTNLCQRQPAEKHSSSAKLEGFFFFFD